jgi:DNA-directed RNA polymerase specialized sigma24 family protein
VYLPAEWVGVGSMSESLVRNYIDKATKSVYLFPAFNRLRGRVSPVRPASRLPSAEKAQSSSLETPDNFTQSRKSLVKEKALASSLRQGLPPRDNCRSHAPDRMPMKHQSAVTQVAFDSLLAWLDPDREQAGKKYEHIRCRLIKIFTCRGRPDADELADETINRVTLKAPHIAQDYVGDPALYFYGVAQKVFLESVRKQPPAVTPPPVEKSEAVEQEYECLERCMERLPPGNRELVLEYYREEKRAKIEHRRRLAERLGIAQNALRIRAHRIRATLQQCVQGCLEQRLAS